MGQNGAAGKGRAGGERRFSDQKVFVGDLAIDEVDVTSTAAELNILDGVTATASELNNAADVSARTQEITSTGAVTAGVQSVELNSINSITATAASADNHQGVFVIKATGHSDDHTFVFTSGTIDGTNSVALFEADNDALVLYIDSNGDGTIVENVGSVSLG